MLSNIINGCSSKTVESDCKSDDKKLVTIIESESWKNDKKQKTQSLKVSSITSNNKSTNNSSKDYENKSSISSSTDSKDYKDTIYNSTR